MTLSAIKRIELKNGDVRYRFVVDVGRDPVTGKRDQDTFTFDTLKEARAELKRVGHEVNQGTYVAPSTLTVDEFLTEWLASATRDVEKSTAANYRDAVLPVRTKLGTRKLQSLTEADVERLVDWMLTEGRRRGGKPGTGLSVRSVSLTLGRFRSALEVAVRRKLVARNVAHYVKVPKAARRAELVATLERRAAAEAAGSAVGPWTAEEVKTFLTGVKAERLHAVALLSLMGLRPAEVCGLRWSEDVDLDAGTIAAGDNTRTLVDGQVEEKGAKSASGHRTLPLPAAALAALKAFKRKQAEEKMAAGESYVNSGYVLVDELGQPFKTDTLRRRMHELMSKVGVRKVRLYDARHACLTYLATTGGVPAPVLAAWAGHADGGKLALKTYVQPDSSHLNAAAKQLDKMLC